MSDDDDHHATRKRKLEELSLEERQQRSRERNREHARRTRMRKKAQLATLQTRVTELQDEGSQLEQALQDCATANILLGLANPLAMPASRVRCDSYVPQRVDAADLFAAMNSHDDESSSRLSDGHDDEEAALVADVAGAPRLSRVGCRSVSPRSDEEDANSDEGCTSPVRLSAGCATSPACRQKVPRTAPPAPLKGPTIHWKNGYTLERDGTRRDLTPDELDTMRRERNRLHAKMTRDRKKLYVETLSRAIANLVEENKRVRATLAQQLDATLSNEPHLLAHRRAPNDPQSFAAAADPRHRRDADRPARYDAGIC